MDPGSPGSTWSLKGHILRLSVRRLSLVIFLQFFIDKSVANP